MEIDVRFDFTTDSPNYWDGFWERKDGLGCGGSDPDTTSPTLQKYHRQLWSKPLPNGQFMELTGGYGSNYLYWKNSDGFRFASDSIIVSFRYKKYKNIIDKYISDCNISDYRQYYEKLIRQSYTIGGAIIFPKHSNSINQRRGTDRLVADRWDLTLECIRRFYKGLDSPLFKYLENDKAFFDLFVDFRGYVDFFLLQDCVSDDFNSVNIWEGSGDFSKEGLPENADGYRDFLKEEFEFLEKRNKRIAEYCKNKSNY